MQVRLSALARTYVREEARYLRKYSRDAAEAFLERMQAVRRDLAQFSGSGFEGEDLPIPGMRRLLRGGYRIDYIVEGGVILIVVVSSSVNTPLAVPADDDFDYESTSDSDP